MKLKQRKRLSSFQIILLGFAGTILLGSLLLMLPFASSSGKITPFSDTLFTATSAVCVTGLVVQNTATYWSAFGQFIILLLIQIGGLGIITMTVFAALVSGRKIGLMQRSTMQEAIAAPKLGGIVKLTKFILKITLTIELIGALLLSTVFCREFGLYGIWLSIFHSVSAFCNAGFDLLGTPVPFSSLTSYSADIMINVVIMLLIIVGGIGFLVWDDIKTHRHHLKRYRMQSKVAILTSLILIILPTIYFFFCEYTNVPTGERFLNSIFHSVSTRTAGMNTSDLTALSPTGQTFTIILMLIGGSPGSTAGGMKTTTISVLLFSAISVFRRKDNVECFGRRIDDSTVKNAAAILLMYIVLFLTGALIISAVEELPLLNCLYETASAVGTVGLTLGITPSLGIVSRIILILLMFFGRVGGLTVVFAAVSSNNNNISKKPLEKITVG